MHPSLLIVIVLKLTAVFAWLAGVPLLWSAVLFLGCDLWVHYQIFMPHASGLLRTFTRFETSREEVWLTIDDGPDARDTPRILELLARHQARATFFLIGERAARHPDLVAAILRQGHEIGHHTHTHPSATFWCASRARVRRELDAALATFAAAGIRPRRFRPPVGIKNIFLHRELADRALICTAWNVRSCDSLARSPEKVVARVLREARPGAILLLHEGPPVRPSVRVHALAAVLDGLHRRGLRCVIPDDAQFH